MALRADLLPALAAFESAARHQNFAHAAEELHLTASAVSHHVRQLEARLGQALFQRHARGVTLTMEGRRLADAASSAFSDVEAVVQGLGKQRDRRAVLRITTLHSLAQSWLIARLPGFVAQHPDIRLRLETEMALTRFDDSGPDLGIRHGALHLREPGLEPFALGHSGFVLHGHAVGLLGVCRQRRIMLAQGVQCVLRPTARLLDGLGGSFAFVAQLRDGHLHLGKALGGGIPLRCQLQTRSLPRPGAHGVRGDDLTRARDDGRAGV